MNKIKTFIKRNEKRNSHLWNNDLIEDLDYIICPITRTRLSMLKKNYIENTLGIPIDEFKQMYPTQKMICDRRIENIKNGLNKIDPDSGQTIHHRTVIKTQEKLNQVSKDGKTGHEKRIESSVKGNLNNIIDGKNGYQRAAIKARPKQIKTLIKQGKISDPATRPDYIIYRDLVRYITNKIKPLIDLPKKGVVARGSGNFVLDHKYSILRGYYDGIDPFLISSTKNLEYILWEDNSKKHTNCSIDKNELILDINENNKSFNRVKILIDDMKSGKYSSIVELYRILKP